MATASKSKVEEKNTGMNRAASRFGVKVKPKNLKATVKRIIQLFAASKGLMILVMSCVLLSTLASLFVPLVIGRLIDMIEQRSNFIEQTIIILAGLYAIASILGWLSNFLVAKISQNTVNNLRLKLFHQLEKLPLKYFDQRSHGDIMSRFTNDLEAVSQVINESTITLISSMVTVFGSLFIMARLNMLLASGVLLSVPLIYGLSKVIAKMTISKFQGQQKAVGAINGIVEESVNGLTIIQSYHQEAHIIEKFHQVNEEAFVYGKAAQIWSGLLMPLMNVINNLTFAIIGILGGYLAIEGVISIGVIASFIAYSRQFVRPLNELAFIYNSLMAAIAGAERVFEVLDETIEPRNTQGIVKTLSGDLTFEDISFGYNSEVKVLKGISFDVKKGEKVAIVGPTGAGKTTMINILSQFYRHDEGRIILDGIDITQYKYSEFLKQLGIVLQDSYLFSGSINDNIAYGKIGATNEEVLSAAKFAMVHDIIEKLPQKYETKLTFGGLNLSHGERQLVTIARAVMANPNILILDEATSSVDLKTEKEITKAMNRLMAGRTSFVIAHRLSTIRDADLILVIDDGTILEKGRHEDLMSLGGFYSKMIGLQQS